MFVIFIRYWQILENVWMPLIRCIIMIYVSYMSFVLSCTETAIFVAFVVVEFTFVCLRTHST